MNPIHYSLQLLVKGFENDFTGAYSILKGSRQVKLNTNISIHLDWVKIDLHDGAL